MKKTLAMKLPGRKMKNYIKPERTTTTTNNPQPITRTHNQRPPTPPTTQTNNQQPQTQSQHRPTTHNRNGDSNPNHSCHNPNYARTGGEGAGAGQRGARAVPEGAVARHQPCGYRRRYRPRDRTRRFGRRAVGGERPGSLSQTVTTIGPLPRVLPRQVLPHAAMRLLRSSRRQTGIRHKPPGIGPGTATPTIGVHFQPSFHALTSLTRSYIGKKETLRREENNGDLEKIQCKENEVD